ncbi:MAG TPA: hypothetical protein V6D11_14990 [Waterburya sp.]
MDIPTIFKPAFNASEREKAQVFNSNLRNFEKSTAKMTELQRLEATTIRTLNPVVEGSSPSSPSGHLLQLTGN